MAAQIDFLHDRYFCATPKDSIFPSQDARHSGFDNRTGPILVIFVGPMPQKPKIRRRMTVSVGAPLMSL